jgi:hypothetical protein
MTSSGQGLESYSSCSYMQEVGVCLDGLLLKIANSSVAVSEERTQIMHKTEHRQPNTLHLDPSYIMMIS